MAVSITSVKSGSPAAAAGIRPGSSLLSVNGHEINDVLDYGFYTAERALRLALTGPDGAMIKKTVRKGEYEELGLESDSFLMDGQHRCSNNCVFCFIDQLPAGLRESLYFKDDDERLSYLFGNYVTLTNLSDAEIERIIEMKIEPINISVHTTNGELRGRMMGNRFAGDKLRHLYRLAAAGVPINCQIVLCRGMNDGDELRSTLGDLYALLPSVRSVACVPVGLTRYREGLPQLTPYDKSSAEEVINIIERANAPLLESEGRRFVYPSDEFFLLAGREIPPLEYYGELLQLENGVGMLAQFKDEFYSALKNRKCSDEPGRCAVVTGEAPVRTISELVERALAKFPAAGAEVFSIKNDFFGGRITVTGLVTAGDIAKQLSGRLEGFDRVLIPSDMLRREGDMFLDSVTLAQLEARLQKPLRVVSGGADFLDALTGR